MTTKRSKPKAAAPPQASAARPAETIVLDKADMTPARIKFREMVARATDFAFPKEGDDDSFSPTARGSLKESIEAHGGIHTPLLVNPFGDGTFVAVDGHRR